MILGDKIIELRKKHNMTQEDLAEQLNVSRQSISKWEGSQSSPDLNKILKLSKVFGVTTDYLLNDDMVSEDSEATYEPGEEWRTVSLEDAHQYLEDKQDFAHRIGLAVVFLISSVIPIIVLTAPGTQAIVPVNVGEAFGVGALFLMLAIGVGSIIFTNMKMYPYDFIEKEPFELDYGVKGFLEKEKEGYRPTHTRQITFGVGLVLLSFIPLVMLNLLFPDFSESYNGYIVGIFLAVLSLGIYMLISTGIYWSSFSSLLEPNTQAVRDSEEYQNRIANVYWPIVTAIFLGYSLFTRDWLRSWIVWPVASVLFAGISAYLTYRAEEKE